MNEESPIEAFWSGFRVGLLLLFIGCVLLFPELLVLFSMIGAGSKGGMNAWQIGATLIIVGGGVCAVAYWIGITIRAFLAKRSYYGMGLLSVLLIPLLFFGVCTTLVPPIHISRPPPHQNPAVSGVDSRQTGK